MSMELILSLYEWDLSQKKAEAQMQISRLEKDARQDEANLLKARRNVYGHFSTALQAYRRQGEGTIERYRELMEKIFQNWSEAKAAAELHQDVQRAAVEEVKLQAWREAMSLLDNRVREGNA